MSKEDTAKRQPNPRRPQGQRRPRPQQQQQQRPPRTPRQVQQKPKSVLFDEQERSAMQRSSAPHETSLLGVWLTMIPIIILLIASLVLNIFLYRDAREAASENLRLTRELKQAQEELEAVQVRVDGQENEIQNIKQAIQTLQDWSQED